MMRVWAAMRESDGLANSRDRIHPYSAKEEMARE